MPRQPTDGADERSGYATPGVRPWVAVLIAVGSSLIGLAIEAGLGHQELGGVFATFFFLGCVAAVLVVRQSGIFTAVIQPPLLLFVAVPLAYYLFHSSAFGGLKDILISCGYPLIERFPLMLFTSATVLLIGLVRWYLATSSPNRRAAPAGSQSGLFAALSTRLASAFAGNGSVDEDAGSRPARPRHVVDRPGATRARRPDGNERARATRSRHSRPDEADGRRRQPARRPVRDDERAPEWAEGPRRSARPQRDPRRTPPPQRRERRPEYRDQSPPPRGSRFEPYESGRGYQSHPQYGEYPPYEPREPRRRPAPGSPNSERHPVSRVRYRDSGPSDYSGPSNYSGPDYDPSGFGDERTPRR